MNTTRTLSRLLILALLLMTGCLGFESAHPLSDPLTAKPDQRLVGKWKPQESEDVTYEVSMAGEGFPAGIHKLTIVDGKEKESGYFFISKIDNDRFLNFINPDDDQPTMKVWGADKVKHYGLLSYRIKDQQWQLQPLQEEFLKKAIQQKSINGEVIEEDVPNDLFPDLPDPIDAEPEKLENIEMRLTASTAELRAFFKQHRDELLSEEFEPLERVK